jgi:ATP-binding cassette subfamily B (MDR/TAP) protein 1
MGDNTTEKAGDEKPAQTPETTTEKPTTSSDASPEEKKTQDAVPEKDPKARPEREATPQDYLRVFSYASKWDFVMMAAAALASIGAGTTLPLLNVVFGRLVDDFNGFAIVTGNNENTQSFDGPPPPEMLEFQRKFESQVNRLSLYMFALFIARFGLNYISKFCFRLIGIRMSAAVRLHYLRSLFSQTVHVLDSMPAGAAASTITSTSNTLQLGISEKLGTFLEFTSSIITAIIVAFTFSWSLTLVTASVILFISLVISSKGTRGTPRLRARRPPSRPRLSAPSV